MPTKDQLAQAEKLVAEIMQSDVAAFKAKSKTAADVAAAALGYADEAKSEAAKYLLLKGALQFQVRAADYDGAAATASRLRAEIKDLPDQTLADILSNALRRVPRRQGGRLYAVMDKVQGRMRCAREARELARQAKANPADKALFERLGERYAQLGDWKRAIDAFAAGEGKLAEMAQWEKLYPETGITELTTAKVADVWWDTATASTGELAAAYRIHAAYWYRKAIENNALPGLRLALAEKRIAEAENADEPSQPADAASPKVSSAEATPKAATVSSASKVAVGKGGPQPPPRTLRLGSGVDIEFMGCPAGSFMMGNPDDNGPRSAFRYHKVNITRPFWLSKFKVTHGMWNVYQKLVLTKEDNALGGMKRVHCVKSDEVDAFCEWLTKRYRSNLPKGYVVRMPTEAEWEYALKANVTDQNDPYVQCCSTNIGMVYRVSDDGKTRFRFPELKDYMVAWQLDVKPRLQAAGLWNDVDEEDEKLFLRNSMATIRFQYKTQGTEVGTKQPNAWGIFDMMGNKGEWVMDTIDMSRIQVENHILRMKYQDVLCYAPTETDPLYLANDKVEGRIGRLRRGGHDASGWWVFPVWHKYPSKNAIAPFRLCIGPDLMKEKGFKREKGSK